MNNNPYLDQHALLSNVPAELRALPQWICWAAEPKKDGGLAKKPRLPWKPDAKAWNDPANATTFEAALEAAEAHGYGIGFLLANGYVGVDFDVNDKVVENACAYLGSYTETSPSRRGRKTILRLNGWRPSMQVPPEDSPWRGKAECHVSGFFTITGWKCDNSPSEIASGADKLEAWWTTICAEREIESTFERDKQMVTQALEALLPVQQSGGLDYDAWIRVMFALVNWGRNYNCLSKAKKVFLAFSAQAAKNDPKQTNYKWDHAASRPERENPVTLGTLITMAREIGGAKLEVVAEPPPELIEPEPEPDYVPPSWQDVRAAVAGTPLEVYMRTVAECGDQVSEVGLLADAITLAGMVLNVSDRTIGVEADEKPKAFNIYLLHLAATGSGKGFLTSKLRYMMHRLGCHQLSGVSPAAILNSVTKAQGIEPAAKTGYYLIDELANMLDARNVVASGLMNFFLETYDLGRADWTVSVRGQLRDCTVSPWWPTLIANGQPSVIERQARQTTLSSGTLARLLVASLPPAPPLRQPHGGLEGERSERIKAAYQQYVGSPLHAIRPDTPRCRLHDHRTDNTGAIGARVRLSDDYLPKIAAMLDPEVWITNHVNPEAMARAGVIVDWFYAESLTLIGLCHEDRMQRLIAQTERTIVAAGDKGVTERTLYRSLRLTARDFKEIAATIEARGTAQRRVIPVRGGTTITWVGRNGSCQQVVTHPRDNLCATEQSTYKLSAQG